MTRLTSVIGTVAALVVFATTDVVGQQTDPPEKIPRPDRILVYDFAATHEDLPAWSTPASRHAGTGEAPSEEVLQKGRELGAKVADELVEEIRKMGLPAVSAAGQTPQPGDVMLVGYFESIEEGSAGERVILGFGAGGAELKTKAEGYLMTEQGPHELGTRTEDTSGGKAPGVVVPLAVGVATHNPIGLVAGTALHVGGEVTGKTTIEGKANKTSKKLGEEFEAIFQQQGWI